MDRTTPPPVAVTLTAAAGMLHLAAARGHLDTSLLLVAAFVAVGLAQLVPVVTVGRWPAATREAILAVNLSAVGAWAVSRTVGLPLAGTGVEPAGTGDLITVLLQLVAVVAVLLPHPVVARAGLASFALVGSLAAVTVATPGMADGHGDHDDTAAHAPAARVEVARGSGSDGDGDTRFDDPGSAGAMKDLMTGAVRSSFVAGSGHGEAAPDHAGDGHRDDGHPHD